MSTPLRIVILAFDQANLLDITGPAQIFASASRCDSAQYLLYDVVIASEPGGMIVTSAGVEVNTVALRSIQPKTIHSLIVAGGTITTYQEAPGLSDWIRRHQACFARIASVCTGAFITAASGVLDDRRAVTHWRYFEKFQECFPAIHAERDPIYIKDSHVWSSAGVTAGIDLAMAMVQEDFGRQIALETARDNVVFIKRPGGQNQFSVMLDAQTRDAAGRFDDLHEWICDHLDQPLSVNQLAERMHMSPRNFSRNYTRTMGNSPARAVELTRLETARRLLESGDARLNQISRQCGFASEEKMRRAFMRHLGLTAKEYRQRFKSQ